MNRKYAVSACLCGTACRYDGGAKPDAAVKDFAQGNGAMLLCPELLMLPCPRPPCELNADRQVLSQDGRNLTAEFRKGAELTLALCKEQGITHAILKERSPSCGVHKIYDGTFTGTTIAGMGLTARLLLENGITVISEEDFHEGWIL